MMLRKRQPDINKRDKLSVLSIFSAQHGSDQEACVIEYKYTAIIIQNTYVICTIYKLNYCGLVTPYGDIELV